MFEELKLNEFKVARPLFHGFDYSLSIEAAIEGNNPGRIFVDNLHDPHTGLALTVEGYLLAGDNGNPETNEALRHLFKEQIFTGKVFVNGDWSLSLAVHPETWEAKLPELIPAYEIEKLERYQYLCRAVKFDWRKNLPEGYTVCRVDRAFLNDPQIIFPDELREWLNFEEVWWTQENFLSKGISFAVLHEHDVVTWCYPDCVAGDRIDVGIFTYRPHRRKSLASVVVAATVEYCLSHGFSAVGWHCNAINVGSWKTAEKVGFERNREYVYYYYMYDPIDHLDELGWYHYQRGNYAKTIHYYERVFTLRAKNPDDRYHLVASAWAWLGNKENALKYLHLAVDHGWTNAEWTKQQAEYSILHNTPEWNAVLARMNPDRVGNGG